MSPLAKKEGVDGLASVRARHILVKIRVSRTFVRFLYATGRKRLFLQDQAKVIR
jgi:hypothetical protein